MGSDGHSQKFDIREYMKRWPQLYYVAVFVFAPAYLGGLSPKKFIKKYAKEGTRLDLGSGPRRLDPSIKNVDITPYDTVDIVADIAKVPLPDASAAMIICDNALEHVKDPGSAVREIKRLLMPGGVAYICTPFVYPFHSSPSDFQRWTTEGYKAMFEDCEMLEIGVRSGPFSTLTAFLCYFFASLLSFGSRKIYSLLSTALIFIFFPIKYLDVIGNRLPFATDTACLLYCVVRKPQ